MTEQGALFELPSMLRPWQRSSLAEPREGRAHGLSTDTERAAARAVAPRTGKFRAAILEQLRAEAGGLTAYELWQRIGGLQYSIAPRLPELVRAGLVQDSGERRDTPSGSPAIVYRLSARALGMVSPDGEFA